MATAETKTNLSTTAKAIAKSASTTLAAEIKKLNLPKKDSDSLLKKVASVSKAADVVVNAVKKLEAEMKAATKLVGDASKKKAADDKIAAKAAAQPKPTAAKAATKAVAAKAAPKAAASKAAPKAAAAKATETVVKPAAKKAAPKAPAKK